MIVLACAAVVVLPANPLSTLDGSRRNPIATVDSADEPEHLGLVYG